jgi:hypothetical protein
MRAGTYVPLLHFVSYVLWLMQLMQLVQLMHLVPGDINWSPLTCILEHEAARWWNFIIAAPYEFRDFINIFI